VPILKTGMIFAYNFLSMKLILPIGINLLLLEIIVISHRFLAHVLKDYLKFNPKKNRSKI
jgi:hypothetical protein